jgi:Predicted ATP-dependent endonuclease of the OLD family
MKLSQFSVSRYRSILEAEKIAVSETTILIGRNNEGKSNILKALNTALTHLKFTRLKRPDGSYLRMRMAPHSAGGYDWARDFPIPLQEKKTGDKRTRFRLDFTLSAEENEEFEGAVGLANNGTIPIEILINSQNESTINILKPGKGAASYTKRLPEVCSFVSQKLDFIMFLLSAQKATRRM